MLKVLKQCPKCKSEKDINDFHDNKRNKKDGKSWICKLCMNANSKKHYKENKEKCLLASKNWFEKNKDKAHKWKSAYVKRIRVTREYKLNKYFHKKLNKKLKQVNEKYLDYFSPTVGCTTRELKKYVETLFREQMSWENYGKIWNIDHIIPVIAFSDEERLYINHYLNLQPLFIVENIRKGKSYSEQDKAALIDKINKLKSGATIDN